MTPDDQVAFDLDHFGWWNGVSAGDLGPVRNTGLLPYVLSPIGRAVDAFDNAAGRDLAGTINGIGNVVERPVASLESAYGTVKGVVEHPISTAVSIWHEGVAAGRALVNNYNTAVHNGTLPQFMGAAVGHAAVFAAAVPSDAEEFDVADAAVEEVGPKSPQSALGVDRTYADPAPAKYDGDISPDTPVHDHNLAQALGGHPTDPENLDIRAWAENARKGALEGQYLQDRTDLIAGGLTPEQADWVLEDQLHWIQTDIHASPVDPLILDRLPSP
jgi:hypothetical protein